MRLEKLYDHILNEKEVQQLWTAAKVYTYKKNEQKQVFSIDTPPPTVSGSLHIGHIFSYTHTDFIARYKRFHGFNVYYPMGFDDNGLPTERFVEKRYNTKAHLMKRSEFITLCLNETQLVEEKFIGLWQAMGLSIDWDMVYSTISQKTQKISQYSFIDLLKKGFIYRKNEPALYCTTCRTSVAQAELDSVEVASTFNNLLFTTEAGEKLVIATTRPELLPACVAIFYNPEDVRYKYLDGQFAITPIFEKPVRIMADDKVDPAKGSGLVMCCTFGDQTDIYWSKTYNLPFQQVIGFDGKWTALSGPLEGLSVHDARKKIIELLLENNALLDRKNISHNVNVHERCKQEIEYLSLQQWFINILDHKDAFLKRADEIEWKPEFMKARYKDWVQNLHWDWCISRQRFFGIPFPVWHCVDCNEILIADVSHLPIDPQETAYPGGMCSRCKGTTIKPDTDVMDTWNTSALTPHIHTNWPNVSTNGITLPMSMRPQAHDIIRTWAFDTIVKAHFHNNTIPWESIMISGHVLAGKEKISKSKENSKTSPEELLKNYPADVIRYWSAHGRLGTDTAFSEHQLSIGQRLLTKLWNAFRFIEEHICFEKEGHSAIIHDSLNQWVLHMLGSMYQNYKQCFDAYDYTGALESIERFFWDTLCDNYLELIKDRFFNAAAYDESLVIETRQVLYTIGFNTLQLFAPFIPYITETIYQKLYNTLHKNLLLHEIICDEKHFIHNYPESYNVISMILHIVNAVRKIKSEHHLSLKTPLKMLCVKTDNNLVQKIMPESFLLKGIAKAENITITTYSDETHNELIKIDESYLVTILFKEKIIAS